MSSHLFSKMVLPLWKGYLSSSDSLVNPQLSDLGDRMWKQVIQAIYTYAAPPLKPLVDGARVSQTYKYMYM